jgi:nucleoside-diphosphate-sugar epimerase
MTEILITGSNGFIGNNILRYFHQNHKDFKFVEFPKGFRLDLNIPKLNNINIRHIFHCAGIAHQISRTSLKQQQLDYNINITLTKNLLISLEKLLNIESFLFISSVGVYGLESGTLISETNVTNPQNLYSKSKLVSEQLIIEWCCKKNIKYTIFRLPLVVGKDAPGNLASMIKAIKSGYYFNIAGGFAQKSMVLVEDISPYILKAIEVGGIYNLTDKLHPSFYNLSLEFSKLLKKNVPYNLSYNQAKFLSFLGDHIGQKFPFNSNTLQKMTNTLTFDDKLATSSFGWAPNPVINNLNNLF